MSPIPPKPAPAPEARVQQPNPGLPGLYFNGFELITTLSDMGVLVMMDSQPQLRLSMSFTTAKTLAEGLSRTVAAFEKATSHNIMNMEGVRVGLEKAAEEKKHQHTTKSASPTFASTLARSRPI
jgi:hypothetical protein